MRLTDDDIARLLSEPKPVDPKAPPLLPARSAKRGHKESQRVVTTPLGAFQVRVRENLLNHLDFSAILLYRIPETNVWFRLRRYNGKSHRHTNQIEGTTIDEQYHIHLATERYQAAGLKEDGYAEATSRFADLSGALRCLQQDCNIEAGNDPKGAQATITSFIQVPK